MKGGIMERILKMKGWQDVLPSWNKKPWRESRRGTNQTQRRWQSYVVK
jgi:hypothetical protein